MAKFKRYWQMTPAEQRADISARLRHARARLETARKEQSLRRLDGKYPLQAHDPRSVPFNERRVAELVAKLVQLKSRPDPVEPE